MPDSAWFYVRKSDNNSKNDRMMVYDIDIMDENGKSIIAFTDFAGVSFSPDSLPTKQVKKEQAGSIKKFKTAWVRIEDQQSNLMSVEGKHIIVSDTKGVLSSNLEEVLNSYNLETKCISFKDEIQMDAIDFYFSESENNSETIGSLEKKVFKYVKNLIELVGNKKINLTFFSIANQFVFSSDILRYEGSGIAGFIGSLTKEMTNWNIKLVDIPSEILKSEDLISILKRPFQKEYTHLAFRKSRFYKQELMPFEMSRKDETRIRENGVYVLLGGSGGLGMETTKYLLSNYNANVIWLGRKSLNEDVKQRLQESSVGSLQPEYIQVDAINKEDLERVYDQIKEKYGKVNGLIHSAIVLEDKLIRTMQEEEFNKAFDPKSIATHNFISTFAKDNLDFVLFYSSMQSQMTAIGQSNYAAGCTYKDTYSKYIRQKFNIPSFTVNWGYWGQVGIVSSEDYNKRMEAMGIAGINIEEGMQVVEEVLSNELAQLVIIKIIE